MSPLVTQWNIIAAPIAQIASFPVPCKNNLLANNIAQPPLVSIFLDIAQFWFAMSHYYYCGLCPGCEPNHRALSGSLMATTPPWATGQLRDSYEAYLVIVFGVYEIVCFSMVASLEILRPISSHCRNYFSLLSTIFYIFSINTTFCQISPFMKSLSFNIS